jgi:hypothetical protein
MMWMRTYLFMGRAFTIDKLRGVNDDFWQMKRIVAEFVLFPLAALGETCACRWGGGKAFWLAREWALS